jgi:hypothetical protein
MERKDWICRKESLRDSTRNDNRSYYIPTQDDPFEQFMDVNFQFEANRIANLESDPASVPDLAQAPLAEWEWQNGNERVRMEEYGSKSIEWRV